MVKQKHIIKKQVFDIRLSTREGAPDIQNEISRVYRSAVIPILDKVCSNLSQDKEIIRIDKLEIDIGNIARTHLAEELPKRVERSLEEALVKKIHDVKNGHAGTAGNDNKPTEFSTPDRSTEIKSREGSDLEQFMHYLRYGSLPWWSPSEASFSPSSIILQLIKESPKELKTELERVLKYHAVRKRFIYQFTDSLIKDTIRLFQPKKTADLIYSLYQDFLMIQQQYGLEKASHTQARQNLWDSAIQYSVAQPSVHFGSSDKVALLSRLIGGIAQINKKDLPYEEITATAMAKVHQAIQALKKKRIKLKTPGLAALVNTIISKNKSIDQPERESLQGKDVSNIDPKGPDKESHKINEPEVDKKEDEQMRAKDSKEANTSRKASTADKQDTEKPPEGQEYPGSKAAKQEIPDGSDVRESVEENKRSELKGENQTKSEKDYSADREPDLEKDFTNKDSLPPPIPGLQNQDKPEQETKAEHGPQDELHTETSQTDKEKPVDEQGDISGVTGRKQPARSPDQSIRAGTSDDAQSGGEQQDEVSGEKPVEKDQDDINKSQTLSQPQDGTIPDEKLTKKETGADIDKDQDLLQQRAFHQSLEPVDSNINNSGLIILWPYLAAFFTGLELVQDEAFINEEAAHRAVHILQYMATGEEETPEHELMLNKLLCGLEVTVPIPLGFSISDTEKEECRNLLQVIVDRWTALKGTSVETIQATFLRKEGILTKEEKGWVLKVERNTVDMLMDKLPWAISIVRLPWNEETIYTEW